MINIDAETGAVTMYSGKPSNIIEELLMDETNPKIQKERALEIYTDALRVKLEWRENQDKDTPKYELIYKQTTNNSEKKFSDFGREVRYIDAHTGEKIWSK
ncbi:peptidase propeptide and YPEB domain protein [Bacillus clarus]|uniref:Peptidase propeptide and YPEB domain protein n=1 Tax=Bacillus clarus TaxID=2338372 RepID=A0A090YXQ2_9BACI|nr:peptidase propeptide and YPEB domain protein [Bacillus clarus]